ncbi:MAG TPA: Ig-like domain-containing protein, partial [Mycobacterium sp.]|nr:Ig-like domain-containing protein [Mycobacterium sp.]HQC76684.1 Ig-like domain-containing protein [Mycobacterium sp.]
NGSTSRAVSIINDDPAPAGARGGVPAAALDVSSAVVTKNQPTVISETVLSTPTVSTGALIAYAARADAPSIGEILQDTLFHKSAAVNLRQSTSAGLITGGLNGSTADGSNITYTVVQAPTRGSVVLAQDGSFTYTPNASLAAAGGTDTFIVTVDNGNPAYRLSGIGGAIQGIFSTLAQLIGLRQPDAITVEVPVSVIGSLQHNTVIATIAIPGSYGSPRGIAVTPDGSRVYVANDLDYIVPLFNNRVHRYAVAMISTSNNSVSAPIPAGSTPFQVAIAPDGSRVYVANFDGTVSAINTATNSVKTIRTVPGGLSGMAITPDGKSIYLTGDGGLSVINTATGALSANIFLGTSPASVAINPAGTRAYVASGSTGDSEQVQVIDTATQNISATVPIHGDAGWAIGWNPAAAIAVSPDGTRVYVTSLFRVAIDTFNHDSVSVIDTATNTVIGDPITVDFEPVALVVSSDGKRVYVGNGNGTVSVIDTTRNAVTATIPVGSFSIAGLALSPDGSRLYVTDQMGGKVAVIAT